MTLLITLFLEKLRTDGWIGYHDDIGDESFTHLDDPNPVSYYLSYLWSIL